MPKVALTDFGDSGYFILHVNGIKAPALKPFETIRADIETAWIKNQQAIVAETKLKFLINRLKGSETLADIAKELNIKIQKSSEFLRTGAGLNIQLPGKLINAVFKAKGKDFVSAASSNSSFIGQVRAVKLADSDSVLNSNKKTLAALKKQLLENITSDMSTQFANALRKTLGVSINNAAVNSAF
jgi:peptidyl-prolyl cis-trans isomerase D